MIYHQPYPFYYDSYRSWVSRGGTVHAEPGIHYGHPPGSVTRGGFGSTGEGHGSAGGHGAGE